jgi:prepilin-type N-terminal cleavage/methylation domain-containing protein
LRSAAAFYEERLQPHGFTLVEVVLAASLAAAVAAGAVTLLRGALSAQNRHTASTAPQAPQASNVLREVSGAVPLSVSDTSATLWVPGPQGSGGAIVTYSFGQDGLRRTQGPTGPQDRLPWQEGGRFEAYNLEGMPAHPSTAPRRVTLRTREGHALASLVHPGLTHVATASVRRVIP